jgi:hypothetical protein
MRYNTKNISRIFVIWLVLATFTPAAIISNSVHSAILESEMIISDSKDKSARKIEELKVKKALENKIVSQKLMQHGLSGEEAQNKISLMTDEEVHQLAVLSDRLPAGGDSGVGFVVGVLVIAALVLLIIYLAKRV